MPETAIRVEQLSKRYRIGEQRAPYKTLRETVTSLASSPFRRLRTALGGRSARSVTENTIWALHNVCFEVKAGDAVGIVGRNGAGKSTLLKVLSRITEPTEGRAEIHGRVGSLLEVGTGFHPELTGRENIYLNGAILGMRRAEIARKLDDIVNFSEINKFVDTPVKYYSSGMYLRLAFSVAAHLETEILLVDEVLAVGDIAFQKRCLGKMESVAAEGRTVLFVSHNLGALKELCESVLVLENGAVAFRGRAVEGLAYYVRQLSTGDAPSRRGTGWSGVRVRDNGNVPGSPILSHQPFFVDATLDVTGDLRKARLFCLVEDSSGNGIVHNFVDEEAIGLKGLSAGRYKFRVEVPPLWLIPDIYTLYLKLIGRHASGAIERQFSERVILNVSDRSGQSAGRVRATLIPPLKWVVSAQGASADTSVAR